MSHVEVTRQGVVISVKKSYLVCVGIKLVSRLVESIPKDLLSQIFQYLKQQTHLLTFEVEKQVINLFCGSIVNDRDDIIEGYGDLIKDLDYIIPSYIDTEYLTGYQLSLAMIDKLEFHDRYFELCGIFSQIMVLTDLDVHDFHPKIVQILLEIPGSSIFLSYNRLKEEHYSLSIKLSSSKKEELPQNLDLIVNNLKSTPYLTGKLEILQNKSIKKSPGMALLGLHSDFITSFQFESLCLLLPNVIPERTFIVIPEALPLIYQNQVNAEDNVDDKLLLDSQTAVQDDTDVDKNTDIIENQVIEDVDLPLELQRFNQKLLQSKWKIIEVTSIQSGFEYLYTVKNENLSLEFTVTNNEVIDISVITVLSSTLSLNDV